LVLTGQPSLGFGHLTCFSRVRHCLLPTKSKTVRVNPTPQNNRPPPAPFNQSSCYKKVEPVVIIHSPGTSRTFTQKYPFPLTLVRRFNLTHFEFRESRGYLPNLLSPRFSSLIQSDLLSTSSEAFCGNLGDRPPLLEPLVSSLIGFFFPANDEGPIFSVGADIKKRPFMDEAPRRPRKQFFFPSPAREL